MTQQAIDILCSVIGLALVTAILLFATAEPRSPSIED